VKNTEIEPKQIEFWFISVRTKTKNCLFQGHPILNSVEIRIFSELVFTSADTETYTWRHEHAYEDMDIETWKHGYLDMETWRHGEMETWRQGNKLHVNMETWKRGDMETWRHGNMETWKHGDIKTWRHGNMET
jgi:hypothetical protein